MLCQQSAAGQFELVIQLVMDECFTKKSEEKEKLIIITEM